MQHEYTLHIDENCSNCEYRIEKEEFPYFCTLKKSYTGMLMKCRKWKKEEKNMSEDKKIEQLIALGAKKINISKAKYEKISKETKNLIKLNDIEVNIEK